MILGTYVLSSGYYDAYYLRAQKVRTLLRQDFLAAHREVDAILTPDFSHRRPSAKGEKAADPLAMYLSDIYTIGVNLAGLAGRQRCPAASPEGRPAHRPPGHRPALPGSAGLLAIAHAYEQGHDWHRRHPQP